ncbi:MAG: arylsulfatase, partial [Clostridia bacterium]
MKKPNVIFVLTDDQGYADLGCTGNPYIKTPNIDNFYDESIHFSDFHVAPLCAPSRGALMTGRRPLRNGVWATCWGRSILKEGEYTLPECFKDNGYATGMFGKWHLGDNYPSRPEDKGFERVVAHKGGGVGQTPDFWGNDYFDDTYFADGKATEYEGYCTDVWFEQAKDFIKENKDKPFFAYIATNAPHSPYLVDPKYSDQYKNNPEIVYPEFYGMITNIDENFGKLREFLQENDLEDNTILMFMTDNGSSGSCNTDKDQYAKVGYNAGLRGKKGSYYDGGHKVPFFVYWKDGELTGGKDFDSLAVAIDLFPTLSELCGIENKNAEMLDGMSLVPCINGEKITDRTEFLQYRQDTIIPEKWTNAVMYDKWRLVCGKELYNTETDPEQREDLADKYPELLQKMRNSHEIWWEEIEEEVKKYAPIVLGNDAENPAVLNAMDVLG